MPITVAGGDTLRQKYKLLSKGAQGKRLERGLVAGALLVQNDAKRRAAILTGNLRRSIHIGGHEDLNPGGEGIINSSGIGVPGPQIGANTAAVYVGTDVIYAPPVEFGTSRMAARPFMRPAFDSQYKAAIAEVGAVVLESIRKTIA
jgi:HK97 gp10 family phage protein